MGELDVRIKTDIMGENEAKDRAQGRDGGMEAGLEGRGERSGGIGATRKRGTTTAVGIEEMGREEGTGKGGTGIAGQIVHAAEAVHGHLLAKTIQQPGLEPVHHLAQRPPSPAAHLQNLPPIGYAQVHHRRVLEIHENHHAPDRLWPQIGLRQTLQMAALLQRRLRWKRGRWTSTKTLRWLQCVV